MSDFDDIGTDFVETEPRLSDLDMPWPSIDAIRGFIRAANHWSADTPVPFSLVTAFRRDIIAKAYAVWHARRARKRGRVIPASFPRRQRRALRVLLALMNEPWFQVGIALLNAATAMLCWSVREAMLFHSGFRDAPRHMGSPLIAYLRAKLALSTPALPPSWNGWELNPWHASALNALSADGARVVQERIDAAAKSSHYEQMDLLYADLERLGRVAVAEHGEWLCDPDPGPPRALLPFLAHEIEKARAARKKVEEAAPAQPAVPDAPAGGGRSR